jgi:AbiV family abortive infection protein
MTKTESDFVKNNIPDLINKSFQNAKRLFEAAKILRSKGIFGPSLFLSISALEELAKWYFLKQPSVDYSKLESITNHYFKVDIILKIFQEIVNNPQLKKQDSDWLKNNRIKEIREEVLYIKLKPGNNILNWQSRAKQMIKILEIIFNHYK